MTRAALMMAAAAVLLPTALPAAGLSLSYRTELPATAVEKSSISWGKDPFVPAVQLEAAPGQAQSPAQALRLSAVFYNKANPSAIVNDRIVYKGSSVAGQKVIDIGMTHVILHTESGPMRLDLAEIPELRDVNKKD